MYVHIYTYVGTIHDTDHEIKQALYSANHNKAIRMHNLSTILRAYLAHLNTQARLN